MVDKDINFFISQEDRVLAGFIEPILQHALENLDIDTPLSDPLKKAPSQPKLKSLYRSFLSDHLYNHSERQLFLQGFNVLIKNLPRMQGGERVKQELFQICTQFLALMEEMLRQPKILKDKLAKQPLPNFSPDDSSEKSTLQFLSDLEKKCGEGGLSNESIHSVYEVGCKLFEEVNFNEAASLFQVLTFLAPACYEAWFSLGLSHQRQQHYPQAIASYSVALLINAWGIQSYMNVALCYESLHDLKNMGSSLDLAQEMVVRAPFTHSEKMDWNQALHKLRRKNATH